MLYFRRQACLLIAFTWAVVDLSAYSFRGTVEPVPLTTGLKASELPKYLEVLEDPEGEMTIDEVAHPAANNRFGPLGTHILNEGLSDSVYWLRFRLEREQPLPAAMEHWLLGIDKWFLTRYELYHWVEKPAVGGFWEKEVVDTLRGSGPEVKRRPQFHLDISTEGEETYYLRVESASTVFLPIRISPETSGWLANERRMLWQGLYFGVIGAMILLNVAIFAVTRARAHFWYPVYEAALMLYFLGTSGLSLRFGLWSDNPAVDAHVALTAVCMACIGAGMFARWFLKTRSYNKTVDMLLIVCMGFALVVAVLGFVIGWQAQMALLCMLAFVFPLALLAAGFVALRAGFEPARFYIVALSITTVGVYLFVLTALGLLPFSRLGYYALQGGAALEAVILSLALFDRLRILRKQERAAQRALSRAEEREAVLSLILENSSLGIGFVERRKVIWANRRVAELMRMNPEKVNEAHTSMIFPDDEVFEEFAAESARTMALGQHFEAVRRFRRGDGSYFWGRVLARAIDTVDPGAGAVWIMEDITDKKDAEDSLRKERDRVRALNDELTSQAKIREELMSIAAHDLKNPIAGIDGLARYIEDVLQSSEEEAVPNPQELGELMHDIRQNSAYVLTIIGDLLEAEALDSDQIALNRVRFDLLEVTRFAARHLRPAADAKRISLNIEGNSDLVVFVDHQRLTQALDNLISNAVKFSPLGAQVRIVVSASDDGRHARVSVIDQGPGLTEEDRKHLFGKFRKLSARPTAGESSTGLGLSIVKRIVDLHEGRVWVDTVAGKGATFIVELPLA